MRALRAGAPCASLLILCSSVVAVAAGPARPPNLPPRQLPKALGPIVVPQAVDRQRAGKRLLADLAAKAEVVCLAELVSPNPLANGPGNVLGAGGRILVFNGSGDGIYNVVRVAKCPDKSVHPLDDIEAPLTTASKGDLCLMIRFQYPVRNRRFRFIAIPISEDAFDYAVEAPPPGVSPSTRLSYFLRFLSASDEQTADDALEEISCFPHRELVELKSLLSEDVRARCRRALADVKTRLDQRARWAQLMSAFGTEQDAALLEPQCFNSHIHPDEALNDIALAYLRLTGAQGLDRVDRALRDDPSDSRCDVPAFLAAIRAFGGEQPAGISKERLLHSVRGFLDRPDQFLPASAILARWEHRSPREQFVHFAGFLGAKNPSIAAQALTEVSHYPVLELPESLPRERFLRSVRGFLDRPDQIQTATTVLARWEGWTAHDRLVHFAGFLSSSNHPLAEAALNEINRCSHRQLADVRNLVPKETIDHARSQLADSQASPFNRALAARILGVCGTRDDATLLAAVLSQPRPEFRYVATEFAIAYLLLSDKQALDKIDQWLIQDPNATSQDAHAALDAIVTIANEFPERIPRERLLTSARRLLELPEQAWRAIRFLIEQRDWSAHARVRTLFDNSQSVPLTKWEVVRYFFVALHPPKGIKVDDESRAWAAQSIEELRKKDPKLVSDVEQLFPRNVTKP